MALLGRCRQDGILVLDGKSRIFEKTTPIEATLGVGVTTSQVHPLPVGPGSRPAGTTIGHDQAEAVAQAFEYWYEKHFDYVWRSLRRLGVPQSDIGDLTHDVFVIAWRRRASVHPDRSLRAWLFGVAFRVAAAHRRRSWFRRVESEPDPQVADQGLTPEQTLVVRRELKRLQDALARVPLRQRAVLLLHDFDEVPAAEVAAALEVPLKTVYSRLAAGRKYFRRAFRQAELATAAYLQGDER